MEAIGCDWLINELGPPPDAILRIPPPPVPSFMDIEYLNDMAEAALLADESDQLHNDSFCHWCHWARRIESAAGTGISGTSGTGKKSMMDEMGRPLFFFQPLNVQQRNHYLFLSLSLSLFRPLEWFVHCSLVRPDMLPAPILTIFCVPIA